jgi:hypothetical protein
MQIVLLNGGLGNQMFQIFFGTALANKTKKEVIFDDSYFDLPFGVSPHGNKANAQRRLFNKIFGIELNLLSSRIPPSRWENLLIEISKGNTSMPELFQQFSPPLTLLAETKDYRFSGEVIFPRESEWMSFAGSASAYYHGYWICKDYFDKAKDSLPLSFPEIIEPHNNDYMSRILHIDEDAVGIHIRKFSNEGFNWDIPMDWYAAAIAAIKQRVFKPHFYFFSDDLNWCSQNIARLGLIAGDKFTLVEGNEHESLNFRDMQLMANCKHMIISNSSFSYLAALMNKNGGLKLNPTSRLL